MYHSREDIIKEQLSPIEGLRDKCTNAIKWHSKKYKASKATFFTMSLQYYSLPYLVFHAILEHSGDCFLFWP